MATTFTTQTDTVLATLTDGTKIVSTVLTTAGAGVGASQFTITPLTRVLKFFPAFTTYEANSVGWIIIPGTAANQISIDSVANSAGACLEIISIGV